MTKKTTYLMMIALVLLALTACSEETGKEQLPMEGKPVQFEMTLSGMTVQSRTVTGTDAGRTTSWMEGDAVGIFVYKRGETSGAVATNAKYMLTGDKWVAAQGSEIYATDGQAYDYYAYYPYQEGVTDPTQINIAAKTDQSTSEGTDYGLSDVLAAKNVTVNADATTTPLVFKHLFAMVEVKVAGNMVTKQPSSVVLKGVKVGSKLNIMANMAAATVNTNEQPTSVKMYYLVKETEMVNAPFVYRAVVPAQSIAKETPLVAVNGVGDNAKDYEFQYSTEVTYESGKYRLINVNIGLPKNSIEIPKADLTIDPWGESEAIAGNGSEVVINLVSTPISNATVLAIYNTGNEYSAAIPTASSHWNSQKDALATDFTATLKDDATYRKVIEFTHAAPQASWYKGSVGFHRKEVYEPGFYKLTFKVKATAPKADLRIFIRSSHSAIAGDNWFFLTADQKTGNIGMSPLAEADTWYDRTIYYDFNMITSNTGGAPPADAKKSSLNLSTSAFDNMQLRFVPGTNGTITPRPTFTITDVKLIKIDQSEVPSV
ncbi:fimbrillin family protein [Bacteroides sp.]|uniref:fimbrillin family protein n=1 Tax=Bacteroides sp. TaxID=29523 RepID=UPI002FC74BFA